MLFPNYMRKYTLLKALPIILAVNYFASSQSTISYSKDSSVHNIIMGDSVSRSCRTMTSLDSLMSDSPKTNSIICNNKYINNAVDTNQINNTSADTTKQNENPSGPDLGLAVMIIGGFVAIGSLLARPYISFLR